MLHGMTTGHPGFPDSAIARDTIEAYLKAHYCVSTEPPCTLRIGERNADLLALHSAHGVACSAFVTACNPGGREFPNDENARFQARLEAELRQCGLPFLDGVGRDPSGKWQEASLLVPGLDLAGARNLGVQWKQNGIVWTGADGVPQLILLR